MNDEHPSTASTSKNQIMNVDPVSINEEQVAPTDWEEMILSSIAPDECQCPEWSLLTGKYNSFLFRKLIIFINKRWNMYIATVSSILTVHRIYLYL